MICSSENSIRSAIRRITSLTLVFSGRNSLNNDSWRKLSRLQTSNSWRFSLFLREKRTSKKSGFSLCFADKPKEIVHRCQRIVVGRLVHVEHLDDQGDSRQSKTEHLDERLIVSRWFDDFVLMRLIVRRNRFVNDERRRRCDADSPLSSDVVQTFF